MSTRRPLTDAEAIRKDWYQNGLVNGDGDYDDLTESPWIERLLAPGADVKKIVKAFTARPDWQRDFKDSLEPSYGEPLDAAGQTIALAAYEEGLAARVKAALKELRQMRENPGLTRKGERMRRAIEKGYQLVGQQKAKEIASRTVAARAKLGTKGLVKNPPGEADLRLLGMSPTVAAEMAKAIRKCEGLRGDALHSHVDELLELANQAMDAHGVVALQPEGAYVDRYYYNTVALHVNVGETYDATLLYDTEFGKFYVTSWGDFFEKWEREQESR